MGAAWLIARTELRRRWPSLATLALLVAMVVGAVSLALVGARRSATSVDRFREWAAASDVEFGAWSVDHAEQVTDHLAASPHVVVAVQWSWVNGFFESGPFPDLTINAPSDATLGRTIDRPKILAGRLPAPDAADELLLSETAAKLLGWRTGDTAHFRTWSTADLDLMTSSTEAMPAGFGGPELDLTIVGVGRFPFDLAGDLARQTPFALASPAFLATYPEVGRWSGDTLVRLAPGADLGAVTAGLEAALPDGAAAVTTADAHYADDARRTVRTAAWALVVAAAVMGMAGAYVIAQAVIRQLGGAVVEATTVRQLGMGLTSSARARALPVVIAGGVGVLLGAAGAVLASPLTPFGLARRADPERGVVVQPLIIAPVIAVALAALAGFAYLAARRPERGRRRAGSSAVERAIRAIGLRPAPSIGLRLAAGPGVQRPAVRGAVVAIAAAVATAVGALVVASSLTTLASHPERWGWNWTSRPDIAYVQESDAVYEFIGGDPRLADAGLAYYGTVVPRAADGTAAAAVDASALEVLRGEPSFTVRSGRLPAIDSEVALGHATLEELGAAVGDTVEFVAADGTEPLVATVVGEVILARGAYARATNVAEGAVFTPDALWRVNRDPGGEAEIVFTYADGADAAAFERHATDRFGFRFDMFSRPIAPGAVTAIDEPRRVAGLLALSFVPLAVLALAHAELLSVRGNRRALATARALGMRTGEVRAVLVVEAAVVALAALSIGIPVGLALGRVLWRSLAAGSGTLAWLDVPAGHVALIAVAAALAVPAIGWLCSAGLRRAAPARLLQAEATR